MTSNAMLAEILTTIHEGYENVLRLTRVLSDETTPEIFASTISRRGEVLGEIGECQNRLDLLCGGLDEAAKVFSSKVAAIRKLVALAIAEDSRAQGALRNLMNRNRKELSGLSHSTNAARSYAVQGAYSAGVYR